MGSEEEKIKQQDMPNQPSIEASIEVRNKLAHRLLQWGIKRKTLCTAAMEGVNFLFARTQQTEDGPKGLMIPQKLLDEADYRKTHEVFTSDFIENTKNDLYSLYGAELDSIWKVRGITYLFLHAFRMVFDRYAAIGPYYYDWIRDNDIESIANCVTAAYAECWLKGDKASYQAPYGFAAHPYKIEERSQKRKVISLAPGEVSALQRGYYKQVRYTALRQKQARLEKCKSTYRHNNKNNKAHPVDLIALTMAEANSNGDLEILDYLFKNKYIMDRAEDKRKGRAEGLASACEKYQTYIKKIHDLDTGEKAPVATLRKYVSASMMLHRLERANHFHMFARMAHKIVSGEIDSEKWNPDAWRAFFGRYEGAGYQFFAPCWSNEQVETEGEQGGGKYPKVYAYTDEPLNILDQDFYIRHLFCLDGAETANVEIQLHWQRRQLMQDAMMFVFSFYPPEQQHPWTESDYRFAADFYRKCYAVTEELTEVQFPKLPGKEIRNKPSNEKLFYRRFQEMYENMAAHPYSPLQLGRRAYQTM